MKVELTRSQIEALISAVCEIQAGTTDGWMEPQWRALTNAVGKLRDARENWINGNGRQAKGGS